jgi:hypothetical protein
MHRSVPAFGLHEEQHMQTTTRRAAPPLAALLVLVLAPGAAQAQAKWPRLAAYTLSLATDEAAAYQTSLSLSGPVGEDLRLKLQGWWLAGEADDRAFVGDAYLDYHNDLLRLAAGRKYVVLGPAGVLASPGIFGLELQLRAEPARFQAVVGTLQFLPGVGGTQFIHPGSRAPAHEGITALRLAGPLTGPDAVAPVTLGVNWIHVADESGSSLDASIFVSDWLTLYGEAADCDGDAHAYGLRVSSARTRTDGAATAFVLYHRDIDPGFVPAVLGATSFLEGRKGWAGGLYHQLGPRRAIGVYADGDGAVITWFGSVRL